MVALAKRNLPTNAKASLHDIAMFLPLGHRIRGLPVACLPSAHDP